MKPIEEIITSLNGGERIFFETPQMKGKYVQGATVLKVEPPKVIIETQGKRTTLGDGTMIAIDIAV